MRGKPSNLIIERAVEIWCRKLHNPVFDNGDNGPNGGMSHILATMNIQSDKADISDISKSILIFKESLIKRLIQLKDHPKDGEYFPTWLDTDYHPCKELASAAKIAGIPESQFSCKSSVGMYEDSVGVSFGYGAETIYHYPLNDGRWLITSLRGTESDLEKIKSDAIGSNILGLEVE